MCCKVMMEHTQTELFAAKGRACQPTSCLHSPFMLIISSKGQCDKLEGWVSPHHCLEYGLLAGVGGFSPPTCAVRREALRVIGALLGFGSSWGLRCNSSSRETPSTFTIGVRYSLWPSLTCIMLFIMDLALYVAPGPAPGWTCCMVYPCAMHPL